MKFQYTKHKAKWGRIIKHLEKGVKQYEELSDLERVCCDDSGVLNYSYACDYTSPHGIRLNCNACPLSFEGECPYNTINALYNEGDFEMAISVAEFIRDLPVKKGVEFE